MCSGPNYSTSIAGMCCVKKMVMCSGQNVGFTLAFMSGNKNVGLTFAGMHSGQNVGCGITGI
jgi:hypothetical protein